MTTVLLYLAGIVVAYLLLGITATIAIMLYRGGDDD